MLEEMIRWLVGSVGVGTVAGLVIAGIDHIRRNRNAVVSIWSWYEVRSRDLERGPCLHLSVRNRTPFDLILAKIEILETPYGHVGFPNGSDFQELSTHVRPGPPYTEIPPHEEILFAMREDGMIPRSLTIGVTYWTSKGGDEGTFITRRLKVLMA